MTNLEIKQKIDLNNQIIRDLCSPNQFTLNNAISDLIKENMKLSEQCTHHFVNGYCEYCYKEATHS